MGNPNLDQIRSLIDSGDYDEGLKRLQNHDSSDELEGELLKGEILQLKGKLKKAQSTLEQLIETCESLSEKPLLMLAKLRLALILQELGQTADVNLLIEGTRLLFDEIKRSRDGSSKGLEVIYHVVIGTLDHYSGKFENSVAAIMKGLSYYKKLNLVDRIGFSVNGISLDNLEPHMKGVNYLFMGEVNAANEYFQKCLELANMSGNEQFKAHTLNNLGRVYALTGELDLALAKFKESLALRLKLGNKIDLAYSFTTIGSLYYEQDDFYNSLQYLKQALEIRRELNNPFIARSLFKMIHINLEINDIQAANKLYEELTDLTRKSPHTWIEHFTLLSKALILCNSKRMRMKMQGQDLLINLIDNKTIPHDLKLIAIKQLCDLYIDELKLYGEEEVLNDVLELIETLFEIGEQLDSHSILAEAIILKGKFVLLKGDIERAVELFDEAEAITSEKGLKKLDQVIKREKENLQKELTHWKTLISRNASIVEMMEKASIKEYWQIAMKLKNL
ncbi:MAG: tetratricopeptide repeat protein [Candidatus Heimdallarchaeota archaeon]|nr:tetratricopeptide repeat protein [Candidatus Heimdallarchaeota archaeon]